MGRPWQECEEDGAQHPGVGVGGGVEKELLQPGGKMMR
jgi:hypothetical protein